MSVVSLIVRLVDQLSGRAPSVVKSVQGINGAMQQAAATGSRFSGALVKVGGLLASAGGIGLSAAKIGSALKATVKETAEFEDMLQGIGQTGDLTKEQLGSLRSAILNLSPVIGRLPQQIADIANTLVAAGISPAQAEKMLSPIGRVSVATRSEFADIAKAAMALAQNMEVPADQIEATFDKIWLAAKRGNFELKDMAQFFPAIAAAASSRGMKGVSSAVELAAAAQIVREGAGTPGQAATNLKDLLLKMQAPQTVKKFAEFGVDIKAQIAKGIKEGKSPLETVILETRKVLEKNKNATVGDLFHDQQAQLAMAKLVEKYEEFIKIREEAMKAQGTIANDFKEMSATTKAHLDRLDAAMDRRRKIWAKLLDPIVQRRASTYTRLNNWLGDLPERFPVIAKSIGLFSVAMSDLMSVIGDLAPALLGLASAFAVLRFTGLLRVVWFITRMFGRLVALAASWGVVFPINFVRGFVSGFAAELAPLALLLAPMLLRVLLALFRILTGPVGWALLAAELAWTFRKQLMQAFEWLKNLGAELLQYLQNVDWAGIGSAILEAITNALKSAGEAVLAWLSDLGGKLVAHVTDTAARLANDLKAAFVAALDFTDVGVKVMESLLAGLQQAAQKVIGWVTGFAGKLKSLFSFSFNFPTPGAPQGSGSSPPAATPQSAPGGAASGPLTRNASVTNNNVFNFSGGDPDSLARRVVAALDRQRQSGLYDGSLA